MPFTFKISTSHFETKVLELLNALLAQGLRTMATLADIAADVTSESTLITGVSTLITGLQKQLADALANTTLPPDVQAQVDAIFATAEANKAALAGALAANTPPTPPPVVPVATPVVTAPVTDAPAAQ